MRIFLKKVLFYLRLLGFDPKTLVISLITTPRYIYEYFHLIQLLNNQSSFRITALTPYLLDRYAEGGLARGDYFHQDLLVAQLIFKNKPVKHVDIGSRVDGFAAHVATFRDIEIIDIRPMTSTAANIKFTKADLMQPDWSLINYCDSISCLHALEHFGLGRYGDSIDANGHLKGYENITKTLIKGGKLYISVPIGPQRIEFNAHRVFALNYLIKIFTTNYQIDSFSFIDDKGDLFMDVDLNESIVSSNAKCNYGCGIFEMTKK